jgi:hypothetical protein
MNPRIRDLAEQALKTPPEEVSYDKFVYVMSEDELEKLSDMEIGVGEACSWCGTTILQLE